MTRAEGLFSITPPTTIFGLQHQLVAGEVMRQMTVSDGGKIACADAKVCRFLSDFANFLNTTLFLILQSSSCKLTSDFG